MPVAHAVVNVGCIIFLVSTHTLIPRQDGGESSPAHQLSIHRDIPMPM